jgi:hypothetical protein
MKLSPGEYISRRQLITPDRRNSCFFNWERKNPPFGAPIRKRGKILDSLLSQTVGKEYNRFDPTGQDYLALSVQECQDLSDGNPIDVPELLPKVVD